MTPKKPTAREAAEAYLQEHGRTGGSSLKTIDVFLAGAAFQRERDAEIAQSKEERYQNLTMRQVHRNAMAQEIAEAIRAQESETTSQESEGEG